MCAIRKVVEVVQTFSPTLLVEEWDDQHKSGGCLILYKLCVGGEKGSSTRARSLASPRHASPRRAGPGGAMGAGARRPREWSTEIRPFALRGRGFLLQFLFLVIGFMVSLRGKWSPNRFRSRSRREIGDSATI